MNSKHTDITIVLDRSGSMASVTDDTIGGFNTFLEDQKKQKGTTASITLYQFDHEFETLINAADVKSANKLTKGTYIPRGSTALLDAVGRAINETGKRLSDTPEKERAGKVIFVIITDGYENASKEFKKPQIKEMIQHQTEKYNWQFLYLGADQDSFAEAASYGISADATMNFAKSGGRTRILYRSMSNLVGDLRSEVKSKASFDASDRAVQDEEIAKHKTK